MHPSSNSDLNGAVEYFQKECQNIIAVVNGSVQTIEFFRFDFTFFFQQNHLEAHCFNNLMQTKK